MKNDRIESNRRSDNDLIEGIAGGDQRAMAELFRRHNVHVFRFVTRLVGDANVAEDIVNEVFLDVWRHAGQFEARSQVSTWLLSIARFKVFSNRRRRRDAELDESAAGLIADESDSPEEAVLRTDKGAQLSLCINQLSGQHREVLDLVYYHERTIDEVAEIVHAPRNTVKTRMFYARKHLALLLAGHEDFFRESANVKMATIRRARESVPLSNVEA
jgi:RNA polymerase sigma-70 factor (ECF subfamily)